MAYARAMAMRFCGSLSRRSGSSAGDPIMNVPGGTTTMSGQFRHSLKVLPGFDGGLTPLRAADCALPPGAVSTVTASVSISACTVLEVIIGSSRVGSDPGSDPTENRTIAGGSRRYSPAAYRSSST
jgi:hypothetical protein